MATSTVTRGRLYSFSVEVDFISGQPDDSLAQSSQIGMLVGDYSKMMDEKDIEKDMNDIEEDTNGNEKDMNGCERTRLWPFKLSVDGKNVDAAPCVSSRIHPVNTKESIEKKNHNYVEMM